MLVLILYGKNSDAQMQGLHAMFGLGAFVAPLLVGPFLSTTTPGTSIMNTSNLSSNTNNTTYLDITSITSQNLTSNNTQDVVENASLLTYPYIISMLFFIIPVVTFIGASFKDSGRNQERDKTWQNIQTNDSRAFRGFSLVLLFLFLLLYVGLEVAIGGLIFSFSFKHGILKSKLLATYLTSTFWGSFCVGRFLGILLSMYVRAYRILIMDLLGCIVGGSMLLFLSTTYPAWLWIGTSILGFCMASVFPSTMSWAESFLHVSGKTASILVVGASLGEMTIPLVIGTLMERNGAKSFLPSIFLVIVLAIIVFALASILARRQQKQQRNGFNFHYHKGGEQSNQTRFSKPKGDEVIQLLEDSSEIFSVEN